MDFRQVYFVKQISKMVERLDWKFQITCALKAKGMYNTVVEKVKKPDDEILSEKWTMDDANTMFVLTSSMDFSQITLIEYCENLFEIFEKLDSVYQQKLEFSHMALLERFLNLKMEGNEGIIK
ncbi:hypothetical protein PR048_030431 [Dryococelus australis]|uniref:Uncharacterized protein n=1 Tax=Dryococelus australis TaxID=614101 RepID=A0ABQ9G8Z2_9NEOP|nr:hypothetical protein PR048_030431 [Dryococelus australis]